jgi:hypothetical protein
VRRMRTPVMQEFSDLRLGVFVDRLVKRAGEKYPEKVEGREEAAVRAEVTRFVHKGRRWGLTSEAHATAFTDLSFEWGEDFEDDPERREVRAVLRDRALAPDDKVRRVRELLNRFDGEDPFAGGEEELADPGPSPSELPE